MSFERNYVRRRLSAIADLRDPSSKLNFIPDFIEYIGYFEEKFCLSQPLTIRVGVSKNIWSQVKMHAEQIEAEMLSDGVPESCVWFKRFQVCIQNAKLLEANILKLNDFAPKSASKLKKDHPFIEHLLRLKEADKQAKIGNKRQKVSEFCGTPGHSSYTNERSMRYHLSNYHPECWKASAEDINELERSTKPIDSDKDALPKHVESFINQQPDDDSRRKVQYCKISKD